MYTRPGIFREMIMEPMMDWSDGVTPLLMNTKISIDVKLKSISTDRIATLCPIHYTQTWAPISRAIRRRTFTNR